ncbi:MAG TPA: acyltransferase, partial [Actinomycetota bacterium]|nr:acyltransferase [Actinomycetota bacterium]
MSVAVVPRHQTDVRRAAPPMGYIPGLDGIRAIAVLAVLLYHSGVAGVPGGFLGVDVFFVLSGFLISSLLLQEIERTSAVSFGQFYLRRARRLLPALLATLALSSVLVLLFARDAAAQFRQDAISSMLYVTNWWYVVQDLSYFEAMGRPPMLQHLWSLAVEEQFYLLWPLILVFLYRWRGRPGVGRVALIVSLVSTVLMALGSLVWNVPEAGDASRLYFGTGTHAMG